MKRAVPLAAFVTALVLSFGFGATQAEQGLAAQAIAHEPSAPRTALPGFGEGERPDLQVLLSSIDMTVSLIDAYGRCREEGNGHEACMQMIRNTLEEARSLIGH